MYHRRPSPRHPFNVLDRLLHCSTAQVLALPGWTSYTQNVTEAGRALPMRSKRRPPQIDLVWRRVPSFVKLSFNFNPKTGKHWTCLRCYIDDRQGKPEQIGFWGQPKTLTTVDNFAALDRPNFT
ncbi:hypothetical protein FRB91_001117 [Serendipita sp. 411]|nr:hypothetical protein FRB91_001117 [Serendipita sp. 411]